MSANHLLSDTRVLIALYSLLASAILATPIPAVELQVIEEEDTVTIKDGDSTVLAYRSSPNPFKVYVEEWHTPAGLQVLRDSPHDHVHHHALMYAIGAEDVDFWGEHARYNPGKQVPRDGNSGAVVERDEPSQATIRQTIDWIDKDGNRLLLETRKIALHQGAIAGVSLLTWDSEFRAAEGRDSVKLWGRDYFGLGMRFVTSMDKVGAFAYPADDAGAAKRGTEKAPRADWCAYTAPVNDKPVTVAMFDHPENARHPATWFTMTTPFTYLTATLNLAKEPMTLAAGKPLRLRYGVALWDGKIEAEKIGRAYQTWVGLDGQ